MSDRTSTVELYTRKDMVTVGVYNENMGSIHREIIIMTIMTSGEPKALDDSLQYLLDYKTFACDEIHSIREYLIENEPINTAAAHVRKRLKEHGLLSAEIP